MASRVVNVKCFLGLIIAASLLISLVIFFFDINVVSNLTYLRTVLSDEISPSRLPPPNQVKKSVRKKVLTTFNYAERAKFYHNTLDLDYFHQEDFQKEPPPDSKLSKPTELLRARIIRAERLYTEKVAERSRFLSNHSDEVATSKLESLENIFSPYFDCPFLKENVGAENGPESEQKWVCGFEIYKTQPRPQECVVYTFGGGSNVDFETKWTLRTDCKVFKFQFDKQAIPVNLTLSKQLETSPALKIGTTDHGGVNTLRTILKNHDHGWLDVLVLDINDEIYSILKHFLVDFQVQVLPFAQLIVKFPVGDQKKFIDIFTDLEKQRLRPFHVTKPANGILQYSFFNLRGKHLLLVGEE